MTGRIDQPNPYGFDEWLNGQDDVSGQPMQPTNYHHVTQELLVDACVSEWCAYLGRGETLDEQLEYLGNNCETPHSTLKRILLGERVPSQEVLPDIAQALGISEEQLSEKPPSNMNEAPQKAAARLGDDTIQAELQAQRERIRSKRADRPHLTGQQRPFGYLGED